MLRLIASAETLPVSIDDAKAHSRIVDATLDPQVEGSIRAAAGYMEEHTGLKLQPSIWLDERASWWSGRLLLPIAPVRSIVEIVYLDPDDAEQTVDPSFYRWRRVPEGAEIWLLDAFEKPELADERFDQVRILIEAGFDDPNQTGMDELTLPETARHALLLVFGHWWENREAVNVGNIVSTMPHAIPELFGQLRVYR